MRRNPGLLAALLLGMLAAGCGKRSEPAADVAAGRPTDTPPPPPATPPLAADGSFDVNAMMAANDRAIADNDRTAQAIATRRRADPAKFDSLKAGCERQLGVASDAASAKRIFACIDRTW